MRSAWTLGMLLLLAGLQSACLALPWYSYTHSSGRTIAPEFSANETGENVTRIDYHAFAAKGGNETQRANATAQVETLGRLALVPLGISVVAILIELVWGSRDWARWPGMALTILGLLATVLALAYVWLQLPPVLAGEGVDKVFTSRAVSDGFIRTTVGPAWILGALGLVVYCAHFAFRYQQGSTDLSFVERWRGPR